MPLTKATERFIGYCNKSNIQYSFYGITHLKQSPKFISLLKEVDSKIYKRLLYFPELSIVKGDSSKAVLVSVRNNLMIEKEAHNVYIDLMCEGYNVSICLLKDNKLFWCYLPQLLMKHISKQAYMDLMVKENTWMDVESLEPPAYKKWKVKYPNLPTQNFGVMDFEKSEFKILYE